MANIPVGTKIPVTEYIPLPTPRPVLDKLLDYTPFVPVQGLDLPKVGTEYLYQPIDWIIEFMNEVYVSAGEKWMEVLLFVAALSVFSVVAVSVILSVEWLIRKIWKIRE